MKTDIAANVGKHAFETAGLGRAPFRMVGFGENVISYPDGSSKAGGCCAYCFTGIRFECVIKDADGKTFVVGTDCVNKTGDAGLLKAYKQNPDVRRIAREKREAKGRAAREACNALVEQNRAKLAAQPHPYGFEDRETKKPLTLLDQVQWMISNCGNAGITQYRKALERTIARINS